MGTKMSLRTRRELTRQVQERYLKANKADKSRILEEYVKTTGYHRKTAIRLMHSDLREKTFRKKGGRKRKYTAEIIQKLEKLYEISNYICGQRLQPYIPELIEILERCREMYCTQEEKKLLGSMSSATIDRSLRGYKKQLNGKGKSTTKPGTLLKRQIAIRTALDWDDNRPGFLEVDLVAHCGVSISGVFLYSLTVTDICSGWTENWILPNKSMRSVVQAMESLESYLPFPILGIDSDNGSEFINQMLFSFCSERENPIVFTRSRPYKKNDQAHVEQKNWAVVRNLLGYHRFDQPEHFALIQKIYELNHIYNNFFQPIRKTILRPDKTAGILSPKYDIALTPYRRLLNHPIISVSQKAALLSTYFSNNPASLIQEIRGLVLTLNDCSAYFLT